LQKLITILLGVLLSLPTWATHIVGGGFDVQYIGNSQYEVTLVVYRDCENGQAPFNDPLTIGIFDKETHQLKQSVLMNKMLEERINPTLAQCATKVPGCTEKAVYTRKIALTPTLFNNLEGYYLSWERCCRNHIIQNIIRPEDASMAFYAEIPSPSHFINSTPKLTVNPFTVLCLNNLFTYNYTFSDADNDSLVYELITSINGTLDRFDPNDGNSRPKLNAGPYRTISWGPGYSTDVSIKGNPPLSINSQTGQITVNPSEVGVFAAAFKISEYRNGVLLGFVHLELQFTVVDCISNRFPTITLYQPQLITTDNIYVRIPDSITFKVLVSDDDDLDTVTIESDLSDEPADKVVMTFNQQQRTAEINWNWKTYCDLHNTPPKKIVVTAKDKGCPIPKTSQRVFYVNVLPMPNLPQTDILCLEFLDNQTIVRYGDSALHAKYFKQYNLYRADGDDNYRIIDSINQRINNRYLDVSTPNYNQINYKYFIKIENECGFEGLSSDTLGSFEQLKVIPDRQYLYNATVTNNKWIDVTWNQTKENDFARYFLYKGKMGDELSAYENIKTYHIKTDTNFTDHDVDVHAESYCYYVIMLDTCGNYGPTGQPFCTTLLTGTSEPFTHHLSWNPFVPPTDEAPFSYELYRYPVSTPLNRYFVANSRKPIGTDDKLDIDDGRYEYEVDVVHQPYGWDNTFVVSKSNREMLYQKPKIYVPNAFTPNSDAINDVWNVHDVFVRYFHLKVYNRWGQLVFQTEDKNQKWDGRDLNGGHVPDDVYVYLITYDGWDNETHYQTGNVTLFR
jgi:gliding motility-associated-like protein